MQTMTIPEFHAALKAQGVSSREDFAFRCPMCGTVRSARSLMLGGAGGGFDEVERFLGFSCVGRFTDAGPHKNGVPAGRGCDWTLGGLLSLHCLEVIDQDGVGHPRFEPASAQEAQELAASFGAVA